MSEIPDLVGQEIRQVRPMTEEEFKEHWPLEAENPPRRFEDRKPLVIVTEEGNKIFASQDPEGNGPGSVFGSHEGDHYVLE